jgi:phage baseplate assembly protein gpV
LSELVPALQALVRDELGSVRTVELGIVTQTYTNEGGSGDNNIAISARVRGSALELQHVPVAVGRLGLSVAPRVGDLVVLAFVGGDVNGAVALGFLYDEQTRAPDASATEIVYVVPDDQADADRRFELQLPNSNTLTVKDGSVEIVMGQTTVKVENDGAITLDAKGDVTITSQGSLSLTAQQDVKIEASSSASLKGTSGVTVESSASATLKGSTTTIAGTTSFSAS